MPGDGYFSLVVKTPRALQSGAGTKPPFRELAEPIATLTRRIVGRRGFPHALLFGHWPDIVGAEIARFTLPERIDYPPRRRSGGTLVVRVASPSLAVEIQHAAPAIIAAFNQHSGFDAVAALRLRHGPLPKAPARGPAATADRSGETREDPPSSAAADDSALSSIEDPSLREALRRLGNAIAQRTPNRSR